MTSAQVADPQEVLVYIVDDDDFDLEVAQDALLACRSPNRVRTFSHGKNLFEALDAEQAESGAKELPDLILLDLHMPLMNGIETLTEIRRRDELDGVPVIVLSSSQDESEIAEAFRLGCNSYLDKNEVDVDLKECLDSLQQYWICRPEATPPEAAQN